MIASGYWLSTSAAQVQAEVSNGFTLEQLLSVIGPPTPLGVATVVDGDTIRISGETIRFAGIDAPETGQWCRSKKALDNCGVSAAYALHLLVDESKVACRPLSRDRYGRTVATCSTPETPDIGEELVRQGFAVRYPKYDPQCRYCAAEEEARREKRGVWAGEFQMPWEWRREHSK